MELPVVLRAPSFQVSGVMTLPSFFSPIGIKRTRLRESTIEGPYHKLYYTRKRSSIVLNNAVLICILKPKIRRRRTVLNAHELCVGAETLFFYQHRYYSPCTRVFAEHGLQNDIPYISHKPSRISVG